jgi:hypothetical protein
MINLQKLLLFSIRKNRVKKQLFETEQRFQRVFLPQGPCLNPVRRPVPAVKENILLYGNKGTMEKAGNHVKVFYLLVLVKMEMLI